MDIPNLSNSFQKLNELCSPRVISSFENMYVKVAKVKGTLPFHIHEDQDELFIIHKGSLIMEINNERIKLIEGDVFNVPKGMNHRPIAAEICEVILIEQKDTLHTGKTSYDITRDLEDQLKPL